jgi:glycosyltransferase involved in cell wall biosynthesis
MATPATLDSRKIALLYDVGTHTEIVQRSQRHREGLPTGLRERNVFFKGFMDALLAHGSWAELIALVHNRPSMQAFQQLAKACPPVQAGRRRCQTITEQTIATAFFPRPPAPLLHGPGVPDLRFAWARQTAGTGAFSMCSVLFDSVSHPNTVQALGQLLTAPFEAHDALVCTSQAQLRFVKAILGAWADFLRERMGGQPTARLRLEHIQPGVPIDVFRPVPEEQRQAQRKALKIAPDEVAVLWTGQVSMHLRGHPYPLFTGISEAARRTGKKAVLLLAGWATQEAILKVVADACRIFAPNIRLALIDPLAPANRHALWQAADIYAALDDGVHDSSSIWILQAMASGLSVVASDWNAGRDLVVDGTTGLLVPAWQMRDATGDSVLRLILGELAYDPFLAEYTQTVAVDIPATAGAFTRLFADPSLRQRLGTAARQRVLDHYAWPRIIKSYEALWDALETERLASFARAGAGKPLPAPITYPLPDQIFASYPTAVLSDADQVQAAPDAETRILKLQGMPVTSFAERHRNRDYGLLRALLTAAAAPCTVAQLDQQFHQRGINRTLGRSTLGWMLKYGLLNVVRPTTPAPDAASTVSTGTNQPGAMPASVGVPGTSS